MDSDNPKFNFFDLNNIAYSHLNCNISHGNKEYCKTKEFKSKIGFLKQGSKNPSAKLTEYDIPKIRKLLSEGKTLRSIGKQFNVEHCQINEIKQGRHWKHVPLIQVVSSEG